MATKNLRKKIVSNFIKQEKKWCFVLVYFVAFSLTIIDEDDSAPQIVNELQPLQGFVPENPETGYRILELRINDPDITPDLDQREWTISLSKLPTCQFF